jgi:hypothetical protein
VLYQIVVTLGTIIFESLIWATRPLDATPFWCASKPAGIFSAPNKRNTMSRITIMSGSAKFRRADVCSSYALRGPFFQSNGIKRDNRSLIREWQRTLA